MAKNKIKNEKEDFIDFFIQRTETDKRVIISKGTKGKNERRHFYLYFKENKIIRDEDGPNLPEGHYLIPQFY